MNAAAQRCTPAQPKAETGKAKSSDNAVARLRPGELSRLFWIRWRGKIPDDDGGRRAVRIMLDHLASLGADIDRRMESFLELNVSWMTAADRSVAKNAALDANVFWPKVELGRALNLTYAERCAARITTFRPVDVSFEQLVAIQAEKRRTREQERRRQERMIRQPQEGAPARRAEAILELLPSHGWWDVALIEKELKRSKSVHFSNLTVRSFRPAVHRAIKAGIADGLFDVRPASGPMMPMQIARSGGRK